MTKLELVNNVTRSVHKMGFQLRKHSPAILVVGGVVGVVTSTVMACRATTKLEAILDKHGEKIETFKEVYEKPEMLPEGEVYTEKDRDNDIRNTYFKTGLEVFKLYAPAFALGALSVTAILTSHNILSKRNVALAAAYTALGNDFKGYRSRVIDRFGEQLDKELRYNIKTEEVEEVVQNEDGTESIEKKTVTSIDPNSLGDFTRVYDCGNVGWTKDPEANFMFLKSQQSYANQKLKSKGYLFFNEVLEMLGYPATRHGQVVGWFYDENNPVGDNFVDFGIYNIQSEAVRRFINGYEPSILLDFNVDGYILDKI